MMKGQFGWVQEATALKYIDVTEERPIKMAELLTGSKVAPPEVQATKGAQGHDSSKAATSCKQQEPSIHQDASVDELAAKFNVALTLTSFGDTSAAENTTPGPLALALGALGTMGIPVTVTLPNESGEKITIQVNGGNFNISNC